MNLKRRNGPRAIAALLLLFSIAQIGLQVGPCRTNCNHSDTDNTSGSRQTNHQKQSADPGQRFERDDRRVDPSGATIETGADQSPPSTLDHSEPWTSP